MGDIKVHIRTPMSDSDLRLILGADLKIIQYSDLSNVQFLSELLPKPTDYLILLYETSQNVGHWTALLRYHNLYEFFDPYGMMPDKALTWIPAQRRKMLGQSEPYLSELLDKTDNWVYNTTRYEKMNSKVNTCGDHNCHRIYRLTHNDMDLKDYAEYMEHVKEEYHTTYDEIVAEFAESFGVT